MATKPIIADEIAAAFAGARFFRADMHIHSYGASHDVTDTGFTPQAIVDKAATENLSIIAITDHNEISNVAAAVEAGQAKGVTVIPGVELSTPQGHILMYFPDVKNLEAFYGKLDFADRGTNLSRCTNGMIDCLTKAETLPYRVHRIVSTVDAAGWRPTKGELDR